MRSTASNLVKMVGGNLAPGGYNLNPGDPIGIFTTPNPVMIGIYGAIGVTTLGTFHSTTYYPHMNGGH